MQHGFGSLQLTASLRAQVRWDVSLGDEANTQIRPCRRRHAATIRHPQSVTAAGRFQSSINPRPQIARRHAHHCGAMPQADTSPNQYISESRLTPSECALSVCFAKDAAFGSSTAAAQMRAKTTFKPVWRATIPFGLLPDISSHQRICRQDLLKQLEVATNSIGDSSASYAHLQSSIDSNIASTRSRSIASSRS